MCGRFTLYDLSKFNININNEFKPNFNISPGSSILILNENKLPLIINWGITANIKVWFKFIFYIDIKLRQVI